MNQSKKGRSDDYCSGQGERAVYDTANFYGADPTAVPMVEEFKRLMRL
jgi:hypothetical protein